LAETESERLAVHILLLITFAATLDWSVDKISYNLFPFLFTRVIWIIDYAGVIDFTLLGIAIYLHQTKRKTRYPKNRHDLESFEVT